MVQNKYLENIQHNTEKRPFSIHHTIVPGDTNNALYIHYHSECEFLYLKEGRITFYIEGSEFLLEAGDGIFVPAYMLHNAVKKKEDACEFYAIVFSIEWLFSRTENAYIKPLNENRYECAYAIRSNNVDDKPILDIIKRVDKYMDQKIDEYELKLFGELMICFQTLYSNHLKYIGESHENYKLIKELQTVIDYMNENYMEQMTLDNLAHVAGYSVSRFGHMFKSVTGYTPFEYLNRIRIVKAAQMLTDTNEKITSIADRCGFNNISYFNRMFYKIMGQSPGKYRIEER